MPTYFTRPVLGTLLRRYYCGELDRRGVFRVDQVLTSRPDGTEIPEPPAVQLHTSTPREQLARSVRIDAAAAPLHRRQMFTCGTRAGWLRCPRCEQQKDPSAFYRADGKEKHRRLSVCRACTDAGLINHRRAARVARESE